LCSYDVYTRMAKNVPSLNFVTVMYVKFSEIVLHQKIEIHHACKTLPKVSPNFVQRIFKRGNIQNTSLQVKTELFDMCHHVRNL